MNWTEPILNYFPCNEQEEKDKKVIIECIYKFEDILSRENELIHITSSGFVVNSKRDKVLMVHHNIFNSWSLTGGHADGEENLLLVADKEVREETGVKNLRPVSEDIISLDLLAVQGHIRRGKYVSSHMHISATYIFEADEKDIIRIKADENSAVKWIPIDEIEKYSDEPHMIKIYKKIIAKL